MASDGAEISRLILAARRSLLPAPFPPRRDLDFAGRTSGEVEDATLFHDGFWVQGTRFACCVVRLGGGPAGLVGAHAIKALLRAALRDHPADRGLALSLAALRQSGHLGTVDAAVATLSAGTGQATLGTAGEGRAVRLTEPTVLAREADAAEPPMRLACGEFLLMSIGAGASPDLGAYPDVTDVVAAALAGTRRAVAAAVGVRRLSAERGRSFVLPNAVAEIGPLLAEMGRYLAVAGASPEATAGLDVAMDEVLTNIILYAYEDGQDHEIVVHLLLEDAMLRIEIRDDGMPFDPTDAIGPDLEAGLDERPIGGLGLHFVRSIFATVAYRRAPGWNVLALSKPLVLARAADAGAVCMKPAARITDLILQDNPHCHAPIHPALPVPTPSAHPAMPLMIVKGQPTVLIGNLPAARVTDLSQPCILAACVPGGPGMIAMGSATVLIGGLPAARMSDMTTHPACVAPIPAPTGKILPPCCPTVLIGG